MSCNFKDTVVNVNHIEMVNVVAIVLCCQIFCLRLWQMLLPLYNVIFVTDGKPLWQMLCLRFLADVVANL